MSSFRAAIVLLTSLLIVAGCASMAPDDEEAVTRIESPQLDDADAALALDDVSSVITLIRMAASDAPEPAATGLELEAAFFALTLDNPEPARSLIDTRRAGASSRNAAVRTLIEARLAIRNDRIDAVDAEALTRTAENLPRRLQAYRLQTLAMLADTDGAWAQALSYRLELADLAPAAAMARRNETALWKGLMAAPLPEVETATQADSRGERRGWLQLATRARQSALSTQATREVLADWREANPTHPASDLLATRIIATQRGDTRPPRKVAALLPLSGELAPAGRAIRRGLIAAHYAAADDHGRPALQIIDVGPQGLPAPAAYEQAVNDGATRVIGPLSKSAIKDLVSSTTLSVPVLALNRIDDTEESDGLHQFGLAPEDDARAAAALAGRLGYTRMTAIGSADDWGERVIGAFTRAFTRQGGEVIDTGTYPDRQEDMSLPIRTLFQLDASADRHERIESITGSRLKFEDRRRQDMDGVFVAAFEPAARLIAPQIRFQRGIGLPVVATSQAYPQTASDQANKDMEAVMITRMPWLLDEDTTALARSVRDTLAAADSDRLAGQLFALGLDTYQLLSRLSTLDREPTLQFDGATGALKIDDQDRVRRHLLPTRVYESGLRLLRMPDLDERLPYLP